MHVVLGLLGTIVTILVLLNRLAEIGIDLGGLNPFLWHRRRQWQKKLHGNPVFQIESPLDVTALLATAIAKADGDMSSDEKKTLLSLFQTEFGLSAKGAAELLIASAYLLADGEAVKTNLEKVIKPSLPQFTQDQASSAIKLLTEIGKCDASEAELKQALVNRVREIFDDQFAAKGKWA